jgi:preprotein translocase subunit SecF
MLMILNFYNKTWKMLTLASLVLLIFATIIIAHNIATTGSFMKRSTELSGGKMITASVNGDVDVEKIRAMIPDATVHITRGASTSILVEIPYEMNEKAVIEQLRTVASIGDYNIRTVGPSLGELFFQQAQAAMIFAFLFMAVVVFIVFRSPAPCLIVILAAITDIATTIAIISIMGVQLSLTVLGALLMLIGYSVDTDIVLTNEMLRGKGKDIPDRIKTAMKTGLTMTAGAIVAMSALYLVTDSFVLREIAMVIIIGLLVDMMATWLTNAGVLRFWMERKNKGA